MTLVSSDSTQQFTEAKVNAIPTMNGFELRCECNKLLAKANIGGIIAGQIKCPRCKRINEI